MKRMPVVELEIIFETHSRGFGKIYIYIYSQDLTPEKYICPQTDAHSKSFAAACMILLKYAGCILCQILLPAYCVPRL